MATVNLPYRFNLRDYQVEPWNVVMNPNFKRGILVIPRRNGKDLLCWNLMIAKAMERKGLYYYMGPYYNQIRQIIWYGQDNDGRLFLDYCPQEIVANKTKIDMRIELVNGSQIKLVGSDNIDAIVGTNPFGIVFTEFSLHKPEAWDYLRPILAANGGWALFNGTPRGRNHQYKLHMHARKNPDWYVQFLTRNDTGIPTLEAIEADRKSGMPEEYIQQEYYCSYEAGLVGSYFGDLLEQVESDGRYKSVPWEPDLPVLTSWDLGMDDMMVVWFVQEFGREIRWIDCYADHSKGLDKYVQLLYRKPYVYKAHYFPADISVRELSTGYSRRQTLKNLGLENIKTAPKTSLQDGNNAVRNILPRSWFDKNHCFEGFEALKAYRREWDQKLQVFSNTPVHDGNSHYADGLRTYCQSLIRETKIDDTLPRQSVGWDYNPVFASQMRERFTDPMRFDPFSGRAL
jgi:phage terminase large subunit